MGIEGSCAPTGTLKRRSFGNQDARAMKSRGRWGFREHTLEVVVVVSRAAILVFEP
jgi:hypothetical protein